MYLVIKEGKKKGYNSLSRLMRVEGIDKTVKGQLSTMLENHKLVIGHLVIENVEVDEAPF